ncbi:DUF2267 domain-containing protein [Leptolyngbya sp. FACHB-711]|uniref:DUF2267 domain-containing protein n=1 Tax=unclassified Leptolyngbya TaxID=2650499 RepID=UPI0016837AC5|nr:DUF2267 domain-containing protein [Leptolyngbya sp. FACHB-711]MBD2023007.1 DUF2267 domain-containing protein [Leptolyngbya sp. FACHB-711]
MQYDQFIKHVQSFAQLDSREAAETATGAVLETIADRIVGDEAHQLAAQLPKQLDEYLYGREGQNGTYFSLREFYERVAQKAGVELTIAPTYCRAVFAVLNAAVTPGEFADVKANFSEEYEELFAPPAQV